MSLDDYTLSYVWDRGIFTIIINRISENFSPVLIGQWSERWFCFLLMYSFKVKIFFSSSMSLANHTLNRMSLSTACSYRKYGLSWYWYITTSYINQTVTCLNFWDFRWLMKIEEILSLTIRVPEFLVYVTSKLLMPNLNFRFDFLLFVHVLFWVSGQWQFILWFEFIRRSKKKL